MTGLVSEIRNQQKIGVATDSQTAVTKNGVKSASAFIQFSLTATLKCQLTFANFPFDGHFCKMEVSLKCNCCVK